MKRSSRVLAIPAVLALVAVAGACGAGSVYVGVAVPGPWVGYPGYYHPPTMIGRPPVYWDDDEDEDDADVDAAAERSAAVPGPFVLFHGDW